MILKDRSAVIFAATGAIGSAVAREFAAQGATLHLSGRNPHELRALAHELKATWAKVDATDEPEVTAHLRGLFQGDNPPDIVFNAIGPRADEAHYAVPSHRLSRDQFLLPMEAILWSQFLTARTCAWMWAATSRPGTIVLLSASLTGHFIPFMSGITAACGGVEGLTRTLAAEYGRQGIRINCVRAGGMAETRTIRETTARMAALMGVSTPADAPAVNSVLGRPPRLQETAKAIAFAASGHSSGVAGQVLNVCAGTIVS